MNTPNFLETELALLAHWITERDAIRVRRQSGAAAPWTSDPVLRANRFTNVHRMDDKVSQWLATRWYRPHDNHSPRIQILAAGMARLINWPPTLRDVGWPTTWRPQRVLQVLRARQYEGQKVFTGAYIITGHGGGPKVERVVEALDGLYRAMPHADGRPLLVEDSMAGTAAAVSELPFFGNFIAGQVVADLVYTPLLRNARDTMHWAPRGPGSMRGIARLLGKTKLPEQRKLRATYNNEQFLHYIQALHTVLFARFPAASAVLATRNCILMDLQNCLCEFDKYRRIQLGEGKARNRYDDGAPS